jgi:hypothetical protein
MIEPLYLVRQCCAGKIMGSVTANCGVTGHPFRLQLIWHTLTRL